MSSIVRDVKNTVRPRSPILAPRRFDVERAAAWRVGSVLSALLLSGWVALAQSAYLPSRLGLPNGLHVSAQTGWAYYGGDLDASASGRGVLDPAMTAELAWQPFRHVAFALGVRKAHLSRLRQPEDEAPLLGLGYAMLRLNPTSGRFTPYGQVGLHRTFGGDEMGYGPGGGLGLAVSLSPALHLFAESSMFFVFPDHAIDGTSGGSDFDQLGFLGFGMRIANPGVRYARPTTIDFVEGPRFVTAGSQVRFRAVPARRGSDPIFYLWSTGSGPVLAGQEVEFSFAEPGPVTLTVQAHNAAGSVSETVNLVVVSSEPATPVRVQPEPAPEQTPAPEPRTEPEAKPAPEPVPEPEPPPVADLPSEPPAISVPPAITPSTPDEHPPGRYTWVVGSFADEQAAADAAMRFRTLGSGLEIQPATPTPAGPRYRLTHGSFDTRREALQQRPPAPADAWLLERAPGGEPSPQRVTDRQPPEEPLARVRRSPFFVWVVASLPTKYSAEEKAAQYHRAGFEAEVIPASVSGRPTYRVAIGHFQTRSEALQARTSLRPAGAPADTWLMVVRDLP